MQRRPNFGGEEFGRFPPNEVTASRQPRSSRSAKRNWRQLHQLSTVRSDGIQPTLSTHSAEMANPSKTHLHN
jgi:hypothetical protein